jgi:hypothetical protein
MARPAPSELEAWLAFEVDAALDPGKPRDHRIGPWRFRSDHADVRALRVGGREIVRRVSVTVRDPAWGEVPPRAWSSAVEDTGSAWRLRLAAEYAAGPIDFAWRGVFEIESTTGSASLRVVGRAGSSFDVNRLGLAILHPAEELVGGALTTEGPSGTTRLDATARLLPQRNVDGLLTGLTPPFHRIETQYADGTCVRFALTGMAFEVEDQRNFGDSSFKTYGPPLAGGFPYPVAADAHIDLGVSWETDIADDDRPAPVIRARGLVPRVVLDGPGHDGRPGRVRLGDGRATPGDDVEVVLPVPDADLAALADARPGHVLVREGDRALARREAVAGVRSAIAAAGSDAVVGTAIEAYLVEINRGEPVRLEGPVDVVVCPAVHGGDPLTLAENAPAVRDMLAFAAETLPGRDLSVTLTFRQGPEPDPATAALAGRWAAAVVASLTGGPADVVTLREDLARALPAAFLADLDAARAAGDAEYECDVHALRHRLSWDGGRRQLVLDLGATTDQGES